MGLLAKIKSVFDVFMTIFLMVMVTILALQLFSRGIIGFSFTWVPELARIVFIWMVFIGSYVLAFDDEHIRVDFIESYLTPRQNSILNVIKNILILLVIGVIVYGSYFRMLSKLNEPSLTMPFIKTGYIYLSILIGFFFQGVLIVYKTITDIRSIFG